MPSTLFSALDKKAALLAFVLGLATILGAWSTQIWGGLVPCELCLGERLPYYWGLPVLAAILILWNRLPLAVWYLGMVVVGAIFVWSVYLGAFHAGVEWKFWPGPSACTTSESGALDLSQLNDLNAVKVVPCDVVQWRDPILQLSLAGYNALISLAIVLLVIVALVDQARRGRRRLAAA
ncbi:MAG TPA: disulfide bond formation protein B [Devosiaceae bacterium]|jgi:disulfide bond formation protein DsbB|nr:disulfide bond formation protein B [Devosiaceae bacterium]